MPRFIYQQPGGALMLPAYQAAARLQHQASKPQGGLLFIHSRGGSHPQQQTAGRVIIYRQGGEATARRAAAPGILSNRQPGGSLMVPAYQAAARLQQASNTAGRLVIHPTAAARLQHQASKPQGGSSKQPTDSRGGSIPGEAPASLSVTKIPTNDSLI